MLGKGCSGLFAIRFRQLGTDSSGIFTYYTVIRTIRPSWIHFAEIQIIVKAIADETMLPVVVVKPDRDISWYSNIVKQHYNWEDMFFKVLMPYMEKKYRAGGCKERRIIAGLSMGGFGA